MYKQAEVSGFILYPVIKNPLVLFINNITERITASKYLGWQSSLDLYAGLSSEWRSWGRQKRKDKINPDKLV